jgi:hypothetical protein
MQSIVSSLFSVESIWSFVFQAVIWFVVCIAMIVSMDVARPERSYKTLKKNLGFTLMFMLLSGSLMFVLFGRTPSLGAIG